ncbi:DUF7095 family protein [Halalkalicoccus jeotgali]|uniref:Uncharacterized protein n=1 Tax=Halalkalicoccus jeotgali (strain DSM 18796 / CECT 7217 / JCM 14584 / KCTC 4019 / B3) TaxID=795797 RepID=D8J6X3_HALJB|nr:hypothetical protein [Halalkalicoccus jeotgali]ADJ15926.1 hypothetical protein HacjB3_12725 [Halalkalicoccus jeotgali B3]ELY38022.1 hypothetical protein C497_07929 [Halalkalicoccus jeotgali B3]
MDRSAAVERVERLIETVESEPMPVPVREIWVYGEVSLGLDPIERLDVYLTKDILLESDGGRSEAFEERYGVKGVGQTVRGEWAEAFPEFVRANDNGYAAPERCLAAHLLGDDEPIHLEVCNASFEDNVTQRLQGAMMRNDYERILDPRGVCLWVDGQRSAKALEKLRSGELVLPTLPNALEMLGMDEGEAREAADTLQAYRERQEGATVRGDVV